MANYTKTTIGKENRIELHEKLSLTGAEISLNELPAGANATADTPVVRPSRSSRTKDSSSQISSARAG